MAAISRKRRRPQSDIVYLRGGLASAMEAIDGLRARMDELASQVDALARRRPANTRRVNRK